MHELSMVSALIVEVERALVNRERVAVKAVHVRIGELAGVDPELFRGAYDVCREAVTSLADSELVLSVEAAAWCCASCDVEICAGRALACTACGAPAHLSRGGDVYLDRIEAEVSDV